MSRVKKHKYSLLAFHYFVIVATTLFGCKDKQGTLFESLGPGSTNILFTNEIVETRMQNVMQYEYLYNGGGVGIGDFNEDGLPDIYFTGNTVENKLYINKGNFKFEDVTLVSGVQGKAGWKTGVSVADVNGDGLLDIYVCYSGLGTKEDRSNQLFINKGNNKDLIPIFIDAAAEHGLDVPGSFSTQAAFFDYDIDGDLDMFLLNHSKTFYAPFYNSTKLRNSRHPFFGNSLYRNDNGKFTNVSTSAGIYGGGLNFGLGVAISDFNQDGFSDILVSNDYDEQDFLYLNNGDGTFKDATKKSFGHISKYSMGNDAADLNNDGLVDLVTLDMLPEDNFRQKLLKGPDEYDRYQLAVDSSYHRQQMRNMLQLNRGIDKEGIPKFSEIGQLSGISKTDWSWAVLTADYDNDGLKDMFITNGYLRDYTNMDFIKFEVNEALSKVRARGRELLDNNGKNEYADVIYKLVKKMPSTKVPNYMFKNHDGLTFKNVGDNWGITNPSVSTGAAYADLDNDGDLDLIVNNTNELASVYKNTTDEKTKNNFVKIKLKGKDKNTFALGAKVWISSDSIVQFLENSTTKGFQSSVDPILNFGIGKSSKANVKIQWPNGKITTQQNIDINNLIQFDETLLEPKLDTEEYSKPKEIFSDVTNDIGISFLHSENNFVEFKTDRLALKQNSRLGPKLSVADINNDGLDDFFVGGAAGQCDQLFVAQLNGSYKKKEGECWKNNLDLETIDSAFFDADSDGDDDIYIVSGGSEYPLNSENLKDRLFLNDGEGNFQRAPKSALPLVFSNGSCVTTGDYDNDGDEDIFVGGGVFPGNYPLCSPSVILRNDTDRLTSEVKFTVATNEVNPLLSQPGLITDAIWVDINNDKWLDLVMVGEWMPIRIFVNQDGKLIERTIDLNLGKSNGFWQSLNEADLDGDGDVDLIVGNMGSNMPFKVSANEPLEVYIGDFRGDGSTSSVICSYVQGKSYPIASLDELQEEFPLLKKKFLKYTSYASAQIEDIFSIDQLKKAKHMSIYELQSLYLENKGDTFEAHPLPIEAQFSPTQGAIIKDFTGDNYLDVLLAGNFYPFRVQYGPNDAGKGLLLEGNGKGGYNVVENDRLGIWIEGDVRDLKSLKHGNRNNIIISRNNDSIQAIQLIH